VNDIESERETTAKDIRKPPSEELNIFWYWAIGEISKDNLKWNQHFA
jgi:hypothetical protein